MNGQSGDENKIILDRGKLGRRVKEALRWRAWKLPLIFTVSVVFRQRSEFVFVFLKENPTSRVQRALQEGRLSGRETK